MSGCRQKASEELDQLRKRSGSWVRLTAWCKKTLGLNPHNEEWLISIQNLFCSAFIATVSFRINRYNYSKTISHIKQRYSRFLGIQIKLHGIIVFFYSKFMKVSLERDFLMSKRKSPPPLLLTTTSTTIG